MPWITGFSSFSDFVRLYLNQFMTSTSLVVALYSTMLESHSSFIAVRTASTLSFMSRAMRL